VAPVKADKMIRLTYNLCIIQLEALELLLKNNSNLQKEARFPWWLLSAVVAILAVVMYYFVLR
jgi:hypothetical protein